MNDTSVHQVLFRLAARAPRLSADGLMQRLVTGLANHFGAVACSLHTDASGWAAAAAEPVRIVRKLPRLDRARLETIEARLVKDARESGRMRSALDLEDPDEVEAFLNRTLGVVDIFAFPLATEGEVRAVLVLHLSLDSSPLKDADIHGLMAAGELLALSP
jgi:hypothetical protein